MSQTNWEADKMLDVYIYDYLVKRNLQASAKAFQAEGKVSSDPVAIDAPGGFLFEWWSVFWDIFIARTNENHSDVASSYIETQHVKAREQQQLQQQQQHLASPQQRLHMQQLMMQRHVQQQQQQQQQQRRDGPHILNGTSNGLVGGDSLMRQSPGTASALATKLYEERLKVPLREPLDDVSMKQQFGENMGTMMDSSNPAMLKPAGQPSGQALHATSGAMSGSLPQVQSRNQQLGAIEDIKPEINPILNARTAGPDGSLTGIPGSNQGGNNLTLKGWPLAKPFMQSPQAIHQLQMLTPQQQLLLQAQQNLTSTSTGDVDARRLRMLMNNKSMMIGRDIQSNSMGEVVPNVASMQAPVLPPGDNDILLKKMAQMQQQQHGNIQQQQLMQEALSSQQSHSSGKPPQHQEKTGAMATGSTAMMGSASNPLRGNDQASKSQSGRKRKQTLSSDPANSSGTANTQGPSPSSAPSTPSTHTPGDVISMPTMPQSGGSSKPMMIFNSDGAGPLASPSNQLWDDKADLLVEDGSLEDNVESFLRDDIDPRETASRSMDISKGSTLNEVGSIRASANRVVCCHFSSDGKLLATGGHDKKAILWYTDTLKLKTTLEEHSLAITDVRFSPSMSRLATSSFDKTVRVWDADNPGYSLRTFTGHSASVMSVDFHPNKEDLICSCDGVGEIRYWSINNGNCAGLFKGGTMQVRFQPRLGRCLAAAAENVVSIFDVETQAFRQKLQGHVKTVTSVCWNASGDRLASVSDDLVRVWSLGSGNEYECIYQLNCSGNKFQSCVFHPTYQSLLVIGCYETLELWSMTENKAMTKAAHENLIPSLAASNVTGLVASASHDTFVKLWK